MMIVTLILLCVVIAAAIMLLFSPLKRAGQPYVTILTTGNPVLISLSKTILEDAEVPFLAKGEGVQDLFGIGRIGAGYNFVTGPVEIQVPSNYEKEARVLLAEVETSYNKVDLSELDGE
jgi:hypothetical protein